MWPRIVELMIGVWLMLSPFLFRHPESWTLSWVNDMGGGLLIVVLSLLSFWKPTQHAHFLTGGVALWLAGFAYFAFERPGPPAAQNDITVGLLLLMFFFLPNESSLPPVRWREFYQDRPQSR